MAVSTGAVINTPDAAPRDHTGQHGKLGDTEMTGIPGRIDNNPQSTAPIAFYNTLKPATGVKPWA